jgi:hypothetical protein
MDKKKSQHYNFCYEVLPSLFHSQTDEFLKYFEKDDLKFIEFWWNHVGAQLPSEQLVPFTNAKYEVEDPSPKQKIIFLVFPPPHQEGELYFAALVRNPEKRFAWVRMPSTRILVLAKQSKDRFDTGTELGDLTPRAIFVTQGKGPLPSLGEFKKVVYEMTRPANPAAK